MSAEELSFTVTRTKADYFWAVAVTSLQSPIVPIFFAVALLLVLVPSALSEGGLGGEQLAVLAAIYGVFIALYHILLAGAVWFMARKNWRAPGALAPLSYTFSAAGIGASYELGHGETGWPLWRSAAETKSLILIRHTLGPTHIIPKRSLDRTTLSRLRALLRERFGDKARLQKEDI